MSKSKEYQIVVTVKANSWVDADNFAQSLVRLLRMAGRFITVQTYDAGYKVK